MSPTLSLNAELALPLCSTQTPVPGADPGFNRGRGLEKGFLLQWGTASSKNQNDNFLVVFGQKNIRSILGLGEHWLNNFASVSGPPLVVDVNLNVRSMGPISEIDMVSIVLRTLFRFLSNPFFHDIFPWSFSFFSKCFRNVPYQLILSPFVLCYTWVYFYNLFDLLVTSFFQRHIKWTVTSDKVGWMRDCSLGVPWTSSSPVWTLWRDCGSQIPTLSMGSSPICMWSPPPISCSVSTNKAGSCILWGKGWNVDNIEQNLCFISLILVLGNNGSKCHVKVTQGLTDVQLPAGNIFTAARCFEHCSFPIFFFLNAMSWKISSFVCTSMRISKYVSPETPLGSEMFLLRSWPC